MKQTALAIIIVAAVVFLFLGFFSTAALGQAVTVTATVSNANPKATDMITITATASEVVRFLQINIGGIHGEKTCVDTDRCQVSFRANTYGAISYTYYATASSATAVLAESQLDTITITPECGNRIVESGEECDGTNLGPSPPACNPPSALRCFPANTPFACRYDRTNCAGSGGQRVTVTVSHSPSTPDVNQQVTITASATATGSGNGVNKIEVYVDDTMVQECFGRTTCPATATYSSRGSHTYYATARDDLGNTARDPSSGGTRSFSVGPPPPGSLTVQNAVMPVQVGRSAQVNFSNGVAPYTITTPCNGNIADCSPSSSNNGQFMITGRSAGTTGFDVTDSSSKTGHVDVTVTAGGTPPGTPSCNYPGPNNVPFPVPPNPPRSTKENIGRIMMCHAPGPTVLPSLVSEVNNLYTIGISAVSADVINVPGTGRVDVIADVNTNPRWDWQPVTAGGGGGGGPGPAPRPTPTVSGNRPPTLTSITAAPRRVAPTGTVTMTSVASDPDTVGGRREKVKLLCGTSDSGGGEGGDGGDGGGGGRCGNEIVEGNEQCDRGPDNGACPRPCSRSCTWNNCGGSPTGRVVAIPVTGQLTGSQGACRSGEVELENVRASSGDTTATSGIYCDDDAFTQTLASTTNVRLQCAGSGGKAFIRSGSGRCQTWTFSNNVPDGVSLIDTVNCPGEKTVTLGSGNYIVGVWTTNPSADGIACAPGQGGGTPTPAGGGDGGGDGGDGGDGGGRDGGGSFNADLCSGQLADNNPTCKITKIPDAWKSGGQKNIFCRVQDESGLYSAAHRTSIIVDARGPESEITAPPANSVHRTDFDITVIDSDDSGMDKCYYTVSSSPGPGGATPSLPRGNIAVSRPYNVWRPMDIAYSTKSDIALAVWNNNGGQRSAVGQLIKGDGSLIGNNIVLGTTAEFNGGIKVAYDGDDDLFLVVWGTATGSSAGPAYGSLVKTDGTFVKQNFVIAQGCNIGAHGSSLGSIDYSTSAKKFFVPCTRGVITGGTIAGNFVAPDGTVSSDITIAPSGSGPSVAAGSNNLLVTWHDANGVVYGRLLDNNGGFATAQFQISSGPEFGQVAFFNSGGYDIFFGHFGISRRTVSSGGALGSQSTILPQGASVGFSDMASSGNGYWAVGEHANDQGNSVYEIKGGSAGQPMLITEDIFTPNFVPAVAVIKGNVPLSIMNRAGSAYAQFGSLGSSVGGGGSTPSGAKQRQCNSQTKITVGPGKDCSQQGTCTVSVLATDILGNVGNPKSRDFIIKILSTNITSPESGSYQSENFSVTVRDIGINELTCAYDVYSISGTSTKTVDNAERECNDNFTVTVGVEENCDTIGQNTCRVVTRVTDGTFTDTDEEFFSVDWVTPISEIVDAPAGWVTSDFTISVLDDPQGSQITQCQYRVLSNGTETVRWTTRTCGTGAPSTLTITVGPGKNCRHEGGEACTIFVRPLGRARTPGFGDNVSVAVMMSPNVTDTNGFSMISAITTERGINFSGTTKKELRVATFYVCNSKSNADSCIAAYNSGNKGVGKPNYCGSPFGKCELRCSDQSVSYYLAARGVPIGEFDTEIVVSPVQRATCPVFNIDKINELLKRFMELEVGLGALIMETDSSIRQHGETETANNHTLDILNEALLLVKDHLDYMNVTMQDLTVTKAQQLIDRSNAVLDEVNSLLTGIIAPTRVSLQVNMPPNIRFNKSSVLPVVVTKTGSRDAYGKIYCTIISPDRTILTDRSACMSFGTTTNHDIRFLPNILGTWQYECVLGRSVRPDCSFEVNQTPVAGTFKALPGFGTYIESINAPTTLLRGQLAIVTATVKNPDEVDKFVSVRCDFTDPQIFVRRNTSACTPVTAGSSSDTQIRMIADRLGNWNVSNCQVSASEFEGCIGAVVDNVSRQSANYSVILPDDVFIESITPPPAQVVNGSAVNIVVLATNPKPTPAYVTIECNVHNPSNVVVPSDRKGLEGGASKTFTLNFVADAVGLWTITSCTAHKSVNPDFSGSVPVFSVIDGRTFDVIKGTNLAISSVSFEPEVANNTLATIDVSVRNPSVTRFGRVSCTFKDPLNVRTSNSSQCLQTNGDSTTAFPVKMFMNRKGTWNIESCSVFGSLNSDCSESSLHDSRSNLGSFNSTETVTPPCTTCGDFTFVHIADVSVPTQDVVNNSNVNIDVVAGNPINDDRFAQVSCFVRNPYSVSRLYTSPCEGIQAQKTHNYRITLFTDIVGKWNVTTCSINASTSCSAAVEQHSVNASKTFNVVRGINVSFVSFTLPTDTLMGSTATTRAIVRNPSDATRFARVFCSFRNPQNQVVSNSTACVPVSGTATRAFDVNILGDVVGTWNVDACTIRASLTSDCADVHDSRSNIGSFNITDVICTTCANFTNVHIASVSVPADNVVNNSNVNIDVLAGNPLDDDRFAQVSCFVRNPYGISTLLTSSCDGISTGSTKNYRLQTFVNIVGRWNVTTCSINASTSCSAAVGQHSVNASKTFNVVRGISVSFVSFTLPTDTQVGNVAATKATIRNPSDAVRFARVSCSFRTPANQFTSNSSACTPIGGTAVQEYSINIFADIVGTWGVDACAIRASLTPDCADIHDSRSGIGSFNITSALPPPALSELFVDNISAPSTALNNTNVNVVVTANNTNPANSSYAHTTCKFSDPAGISYFRTSQCLQITANSSQQFIISQLVNKHGIWNISQCSVNASMSNNCAPSLLHNISKESREVNVVLPTDIYITGMNAPDSDAVNNSDVPIDIFVNNPLNDDRFGFVSCVIENPNGATQTRTSPCSVIARQDSKRYNVSVFANVVGTWNAKNCTLRASSNSACSNAAVTSEMINGDLFRVIRGYNLTISNIAVTSPAYVSRPVDVSYTLRNPSISERFGRVTCTFTRSGQSVVNRSACFTLPSETFVDSKTNLTTEVTGTWTVTCVAERSFDSSCASVEVHDTVSRTFDVVNPPDLFIQSVDIQELAPLDNLTHAIVRVKNPVFTPLYGFVECTFKNRLNETTRNRSECVNMTGDTTSSVVGVIPRLRGNWSVSNCVVNASKNTDCTQNRTHNTSTVSKSFTVFAPLLVIEDVFLSSENLFVGDVADIVVDVKNIGEKEYTAFVNCTIFNPSNILYKLTTPNQTIPLGEIRTFHAQRVVDVAGTWRVGRCEAYRYGSIILEDAENVNKQFGVQYVPSTNECSTATPCESGFICQDGRCVPEPPKCSVSNCPGIKEACYCSNNNCIACGEGYTCSGGRCVLEIPVNVCGSNRDCPPDQICLNSVCQQRPVQCYVNSDCAAGLECRDGRCTVTEPVINKDIILFLIIILAVIMIPLILFIYIKRSL